MSRIAGMTDGNKVEHSIELIDGSSDTSPALFRAGVQSINMANADVTLVINSAASGQTILRSNVLRVDPQGNGTPDLMLPSASAMKGHTLYIYNAADAAESFRVRNSGDTTTLATLAQAANCRITSDGTSYIASTTTISTTDFGALGLSTDVIAESTAAAGVTIDGLLLKDGFVAAADNQGVKFGTGSDIVGAWDGTRFNWTQAAPNSEMRYGVDGAGIDQVWYGDTASAFVSWDQSADLLSFQGLAKLGITNRSIGASTAAAGSASGDAGVLPAGTAPVYPTTAADGTKGVRINDADKVTGRQIIIGNNTTAGALKVYPPTGGTINGAAADAAVQTAGGKGITLICTDSGSNTWLAI